MKTTPPVEVRSLRRRADAFERLSAAVLFVDGSRGLDALLPKLLAILLDVAGAEIGVIRLRESDRLRSRASCGLEEEIVAGFSLSVEDGPAPGSPPIWFGGADAIDKNPFFGARGIRAMHVLPLMDRELVGAVYMAVEQEEAILAPEDRELLGLLAARTAAAIVRTKEREAAEQSMRSRDEVLAVVAHDLQNPINIVAIAANTLLQRLPDSSGRRSVERIIRGAQRADRLIRDLLQINAMEAGRFALEKRRVEPPDLVLTALESQQSMAAEASVIIGADLSPELPPIEADEERLLEVLENLVGNAIKFTGPGGAISVGAARRGPELRGSPRAPFDAEILVWVKDNGEGIAPEQLPYIFDRFWQAKKAERRGTGLGLTICKGIVEAHGGRIWAESEVGAGTTLFFTLPARPRVVVSDAQDLQDLQEVANILLVDDRPENLLSLKVILERPDYNLVTARSGQEALSLVLRERFSAALIDVAMPGMNGLEVAVHLKELERSRDIPIIFITAFGDDPQEIHRAYSAGGADYLVKPLDTEIVRKKVAVFVDLSRRRQGSLLEKGHPRWNRAARI